MNIFEKTLINGISKMKDAKENNDRNIKGAIGCRILKVVMNESCIY